MKQAFVVAILILGLLALASCAPSPNDLLNSPGEEGKVAGFWQGLWHGIISPFTFIASLFGADVNIYEVHNNGGWYNFGFLLGASAILGGSGGGAAGARRRKES